MAFDAKGKIHPNTGVSADGETWIKAERIEALSFEQAKPTKKPTRTYRIKTSRGIAGPFSLEKMLGLIAKGRIKPDVAVSEDGETWQRAYRISEFRYAKFCESPVSVSPSPTSKLSIVDLPSNANDPHRLTREKRTRPHWVGLRWKMNHVELPFQNVDKLGGVVRG